MAGTSNKPLFPNVPPDVVVAVTAAAEIRDTQPTTNFGTLTTCTTGVYHNVAGDHKSRTVMWWTDLSSVVTIPSNFTVVQAALFRYVTYSEGHGTFSLRQLTGVSPVEAEITWNLRKAATNWTTAGGDFTLTNETHYGAPPADDGSNPYWHAIYSQQLANIVQTAIIATGFFGLIDMNVSEVNNNGYYNFSSDEAVGFEPRLALWWNRTVTKSEHL